jgi:hypothetical protein
MPMFDDMFVNRVVTGYEVATYGDAESAVLRNPTALASHRGRHMSRVWCQSQKKTKIQKCTDRQAAALAAGI